MNKSTISSFLLAIAGFILISFLWPKISEVQDNKNLLEVKKEMLSNKKTGSQRVAALLRQYQDNKNQVDRLGIFLPDEQRIEYTITSLSTAAEQSGMRLTLLEMSEPELGSANLYNYVDIALELEGDFSGLLAYLKKLENSLRLYDVTNIEIKPDSSYASQLSISMNVRTYTVYNSQVNQ